MVGDGTAERGKRTGKGLGGGVETYGDGRIDRTESVLYYEPLPKDFLAGQGGS